MELIDWSVVSPDLLTSRPSAPVQAEVDAAMVKLIGDREKVRFFHEFCGHLLMASRPSYVLILRGGPRSAKSILAAFIRRMLAPQRVASLTLAELCRPDAVQALREKCVNICEDMQPVSPSILPKFAQLVERRPVDEPVAFIFTLKDAVPIADSRNDKVWERIYVMKLPDVEPDVLAEVSRWLDE